MKRPVQEPASLYSPANANQLKVALYARVSMPQEGEDPRAQDPENQLIPLRRFALEQGHLVYQEYTDRCTGASKDRPGLDQLLRDGRAHRFSLVLTTKVDRFARSVAHLYSLLDDLHGVNVGVRFIDQLEASTDTPQGELVLGILGHVSQFERRLISTRTMAGIVRYRAQNERWGRPRVDVCLEDILSLRAQGRSLREIAEELEVSEWTVRSRLREEKGRVNLPKNDSPERGG